MQEFVDWNEVRVARCGELARALHPFLSDGRAGETARRLVYCLQQIFQSRGTLVKGRRLNQLDELGSYYFITKGSKLAIQETPDGYDLEAAIPWNELLPNSPQKGTFYSISILRTIPAVGLQSWTQPATMTARPTAFGLLKLD